MNTIALLGTIAAILTTSAFVPQVYKTIKSKSASDLSLTTFSMIFIGTILWFIYGYFQNDTPVMIANGITSLLAGILVFMKISSMIPKENNKS